MARRERRDITYEVSRDRLIRTVTLHRGGGYQHNCTLEVYGEVAHIVEESAKEGVTLESIADAHDLPYTQVNVALEFMKERGCLITANRRSYPGTAHLYEDALLEYHALKEESS